MRKFRRKPKVVWLPVHGQDWSMGEGDNFSNGIGGNLVVAADGEIVTEFTPVTFDYSDPASGEEGTEVRSLQDLTSGNAYRLRRLVGKVFVATTPQGTAENVYPTLRVSAGFIINRTDPSGNPLVSSAIGSANETDFGPLAQDAAEDPWIWRRSWILTAVPRYYTGGTSIATLLTLSPEQPFWPSCNSDYGSALDGPHLDQKTARVISSQERLFFWIQARTVQTGGTNDAILNWHVDIRLLASLRQNIGNRRNASR